MQYAYGYNKCNVGKLYFPHRFRCRVTENGEGGVEENTERGLEGG